MLKNVVPPTIPPPALPLPEIAGPVPVFVRWKHGLLELHFVFTSKLPATVFPASAGLIANDAAMASTAQPVPRAAMRIPACDCVLTVVLLFR
jgi:hypothetical protein